MFFSPVHADTAHLYVQTKSSVEDHYLRTFWEKTLTSHAFANAFSDSVGPLLIDEYKSVSDFKSTPNAGNGTVPSASTVSSRSTGMPSQP